MRTITIAQQVFFDHSLNPIDIQLMSLIEPEEVFKKMDTLINANDQVGACAHEQLTSSTSSKR